MLRISKFIKHLNSLNFYGIKPWKNLHAKYVRRYLIRWFSDNYTVNYPFKQYIIGVKLCSVKKIFCFLRTVSSTLYNMTFTAYLFYISFGYLYVSIPTTQRKIRIVNYYWSSISVSVERLSWFTIAKTLIHVHQEKIIC